MARALTFPIFSVFAVQLLIVVGGFAAVLGVLTVQHTQEHQSSVEEKIRLRQDHARLQLLYPFLMREGPIERIGLRMKGDDSLVYNRHRSMEAMEPWLEMAYVELISDSLITMLIQITESEVPHPSGNGRMYWDAAAAIKQFGGLFITTTNSGQADMAFQSGTYPPTYTSTMSVPFDVSTDSWVDTIRRNVNYSSWHPPNVLKNALSNDVNFLTAYSIPLRYDPTNRNRVTSALTFTTDVSQIATLVADARLTPETTALLFDLPSEKLLVSTDTSIAAFRDGNMSDPMWRIWDFPHAAYRAIYYAARDRCPNTTCEYVTFETDNNEVVSMIHLNTSTRLSFHLLQITPRSYFYAASEQSRAIGIAIGVVAAVLVLASCVAVYFSIQGPLSRVRDAMSLAAVLRNEEAAEATGGALSILSEISVIQSAFASMNQRLLLARPFLPQHLLIDDMSGGSGEDDDYEDDDDDEGAIGLKVAGDDDTGSPAVVGDASFTFMAMGTTSEGKGGGGVLTPGQGSIAMMRNETSMSIFNPADVQLLGQSVQLGQSVGGALTSPRTPIAAATTGAVVGAPSSGQRLSMLSATKSDQFAAPATAAAAAATADHKNSSVRTAALVGSIVKQRRGTLERSGGTRWSSLLGHMKINNIHHLGGGGGGNSHGKRVGMLCVNLSDFHGLCASLPTDRVASVQATLARIVESCAQAERGLIDSFQGDHFMLSFNAARACGSVGRAAAACAVHMAERVRSAAGIVEVGGGGGATSSLGGRHLTMGFASGRALVGNMGTASMKRLCIVGPAYGEAVALERLAKHVFSGHNHNHNAAIINIMTNISNPLGLGHPSMPAATTDKGGFGDGAEGVRCLVGEASREGMDMVAYSFIIGAARTRKTGDFRGVRALMEPVQTGAGDEWLYEVNKGNSNDPYLALNTEMVAYLRHQPWNEVRRLDLNESASPAELRSPPSTTVMPPVALMAQQQTTTTTSTGAVPPLATPLAWATEYVSRLKALGPSHGYYDTSVIGGRE